MKEYPHSIDFSFVYNEVSKGALAHVATMDNDQPRVRMMSVTAIDNSLWLLTRSSWSKVRELKENDKIEMTIGFQGEKGVGCIRATGRADLIPDSTTRQKVSEVVPWFKGYWESAEDPDFTLYQLKLSLVRVDHPDDGLKYTVDLSTIKHDSDD